MQESKIKIHLLLVSFLLIIFTSLPYLYLYLSSPTGYKYSLTTYSNPADNYVYYSFIKQAQQGRLIFTNYYTSEGDWGGALRPFWLIVGWFGSLWKTNPMVTFHLFRLFLIPLLVVVIYKCLSLFISNSKQRLLAFYLFFFTSGLGWIYLLFHPYFWLREHWSQIPFDFMMPESFPFFSILISPHFMMSWLLLVGGVILLWQVLTDHVWQSRLSVWTGITLAFLFFIHPFYVPLVGVLGIFFILFSLLSLQSKFDLKEVVKRSLPVLIISLLPLLYYWLLSGYDFSFYVKTIQNFLPSPALNISLYSFGAVWLLALIGSLIYYRQYGFDNKILFLLGWAVLGWFFIYAPLAWQRRLVEGWYFPLIVLSSFALFKIEEVFKRVGGLLSHSRYFFYGLFLILFLLGNLIVAAFNSYFLTSKLWGAFYYPVELAQAGEWLENNTAEHSIIITNDDDAMAKLPFFAQRRVYFAHLVETVFSRAKFNQLIWFFTNDNFAERKYSFLRQARIKFIVFNKDKGPLSNFNPFNKNFLRPIWQQGDFVIFEVK